MKTKIAIVTLSLLVLVAIALFVFMGVNRAPTGDTTTLQQVPHSFSQRFCVNGPGNGTVTDFALKNGINCFRTDIFLSSNEISSISNGTKKGAQYLGILDYNTVGAQPSGNGCVSGCNWTLADWNASVANAIRDYPDVNEWEIYNEPLASIFISGYDNGSALNYFNMIKGAYTIIKSKEPNSTVVCFGGAMMYPVQSAAADYQFYKAVWQYGASRYCDAISLHAYSLPYYDLNQSVYGNVTLGQLYNYTLFMYENMTGKPIWITETGITSNNWVQGLNMSQQKQASFLMQDFGLFASHPYVKRVYWFNLQGPASGNTPDYGLLNAGTLQPKPAFGAFLYFSRNSLS